MSKRVKRESSMSPHEPLSIELDCYPYSFSPLLLFTNSSYFDKGHSNYNAVAQLFRVQLLDECCFDILENVIYERKNMLYEDLLEHVVDQRSLVTCCIDNHFTAFQVISPTSLVYYDPLNPRLTLVYGKDSLVKFACFLLLKCGYGDNQHIQDNKAHYVGENTNPTRREIYRLWQKVNQLEMGNIMYGVKTAPIVLNLDDYFLVNDSKNFRHMSTQATGSTCYFQVFLFGILCKAGDLSQSADGSCIHVGRSDLVKAAALLICRRMLSFFVDSNIYRPLTNNNFVIDFYRFSESAYYLRFNAFAEKHSSGAGQYEAQFSAILDYFKSTKILHKYDKMSTGDPMSSTVNSKSLQRVHRTDDSTYNLCSFNYYKFRAANLMFGFNTNIMRRLTCFCELNSLRKNQLLAHFGDFEQVLAMNRSRPVATKYRDYYFMPQFEIGQPELVDLHYLLYEMDIHAMLDRKQTNGSGDTVRAINHILLQHVLFSTQRTQSYDKIISLEDFKRSKDYMDFYLNNFMTANFFKQFAGLGFPDVNPNEKDVNSLTCTVFYLSDMMRRQAYRQEYEFEKECINQMARSTLVKYMGTMEGRLSQNQRYHVQIRIGQGVTYSKFNTLMHLINTVNCYWDNPDVNAVQLFGKDIRGVLAVSCQKVFFHEGHSYYHYGPIDSQAGVDLQVGNPTSDGVWPSVSRDKPGNSQSIIICDRVYEFNYLRNHIDEMFKEHEDRLKTDDTSINLILLSLLLDFRLFDEHSSKLNIAFLRHHSACVKTQELQVQVSNLIQEFETVNKESALSRSKVEALIFEVSYKFLVSKGFSLRSREFDVINQLNQDPSNQYYFLLCKIYMSLCQINKSVEVDYYRLRVDGDYIIVIPRSFSKATGVYLEDLTRQYYFSERNGYLLHGDLPLFNLKPHRDEQPDISLFRVRFASASLVSSMVKYLEFSNVFQVSEGKYLIFVADNTLLVDSSIPLKTPVNGESPTSMHINKVPVEIASVFFNDALSFVPCFKYVDSEDIIIFTSRSIQYFVDSGGQFNDNYYGMKHELMEQILSAEMFVDANDLHTFKSSKLSELETESKTLFYFPDYMFQVHSREQLVNLLGFAIQIRNLSFFILTLMYLRRASVNLEYNVRENKITKISGPWYEAIAYVLNKVDNAHYDAIFKKQFIDLNGCREMPLQSFIETICDEFTRFQKQVDGHYEIVPTQKQKAFLERLICSEECFHFSEVGSGKTKVILPLLCQIFLSNNEEAHRYLSRGGPQKTVLVVLVPEHLLHDAKMQVFRYCLNLNFRDEYRIYDDLFALLHENVQLNKRKKIFVTSFNQVKKALTYDEICRKIANDKEKFLFVVDEVDDFLDRDKLVFNICSNKNSDLQESVLDAYYTVCHSVYQGETLRIEDAQEDNPEYWNQLFVKFSAIHLEIQDQSRSINKSFGIFNEQTLRHCSGNIAHDVEGYKALIARPYESVNRAMPGSYYTDVERTMYLTYYILMEDTSKYDDLFQQERKFINFQYFKKFLDCMDYDELVYGSTPLSSLVIQHPAIKNGIARFLYKIILRRMEIRDRSRSVNSIDLVFHFDCLGFTGTPFIDNYPTARYVRANRQDRIPNMIDRSFYVYGAANKELEQAEFEDRFSQFQGTNDHVVVKYKSSDFIESSENELAILETAFLKEDAGSSCFNALVDLCGVFKKTTTSEIAKLIRQKFPHLGFRYIYHVDQVDGSDRVLYIDSDNDVPFDGEFYNYLCRKYQSELREKVFFFIDNRNVIGKDVPFQLAYKNHFSAPIFRKSVVIGHDVDDFSKIWQAMGRSRTMNDTEFVIYLRSTFLHHSEVSEQVDASDIKSQKLTRQLYVRNCDRKSVGNLSSIYQTLISLVNLGNEMLYHNNDIVNLFLDKLERTIEGKVKRHETSIARSILGSPLCRGILKHLLEEKFRNDPTLTGLALDLSDRDLESIVRNIVRQAFEQRPTCEDEWDVVISFLSGEQAGRLEVSYTKQQQKQKTKQHNKNQDSDVMEVFDRKNQLLVEDETEDYFLYTSNCVRDRDTTVPWPVDSVKRLLNLPLPWPVLKLSYSLNGRRMCINVYPTVQFLYSNHIHPSYISSEVKQLVASAVTADWPNNLQKFWEIIASHESEQPQSDSTEDLDIQVLARYIQQNPQYTLAGIRQGCYVIGMKDQFNSADIESNMLNNKVRYVSDELGFILLDRTQREGGSSIHTFGPYFVEQYIIMSTLSKSEVAQNVLEYYTHHKKELQDCLDRYDEKQGKGFICWRFVMSDLS